MSDLPTFVAFAANGLFSGSSASYSNAFNQDTDSVPLSAAASVYSGSNILSANGWYAAPGAVEPLGPSGCTALGTGGYFCGILNEGTTYQSAVSGRFYSLRHKDSRATIAGIDLLKQLDAGMANVPVLFDGAYNCTYEGKAGNLLGVHVDGTLDVACMSALPMYLDKDWVCPAGAVYVGGKCPFGFY